MSLQTQHIGVSAIRESMSMAQCIDAMAFGFAALNEGQATVPERTVHEYQAQNSTQLIMPAILHELDLLVTKLVTVNPSNSSAGLPLIHALIVAQRASTGEVIATLDGSEITAMRTAAASGLATRLFALTGSDTLGIIGTGTQGRYHVEAMLEVLPIERILVRGSSTEKTNVFCKEIEEAYGVECRVANGLRTSGVICACTTSTTPVLGLEDVAKGTHINAVGSFRLTDRELDTSLIQASRLIIDEWAGCETEAGDVMIPINEGAIDRDHVIGELGYWASNVSSIQRRPEDITVFKSVGNAVQDAAAVACVLGLL